MNASNPPRAPDANSMSKATDRLPFWRVCAVFLVTFALLQWGWSHSRDTWIERLVVHTGTVTPAAFLINLISPEAGAQAVGASIKAKGGGLNVRNGCEGVEIMFLLIAAFASVPMTWRQRLAGLALGVAGVFMLNLARILTLFYVFRGHRPLFDSLHTLVLPALLVTAVALYFYGYLHRLRPNLA